MHTIAIIGAGFSGTMTAVHLLRNHAVGPVQIALIERSGRFTAGVAYGTPFGNHLLNVPAGRMTAFEDDQDHFLRWVQSRDGSISGGSFVPRMLYGEYLAWVLSDAEGQAPAHRQVKCIADEAIGIRSQPNGRFSVQLKNSASMEVDCVLLAIGNYPPADPPVEGMSFYQSALYARDPWAADALKIDRDRAVLLMGTGLTMLDIAIALRDMDHRGEIHALSRRGLLPQPHRVSKKPPPNHDRPKGLDSWERTAAGLCRALRAEVKSAARNKVNWREVITSVRADTPALWQSLSHAERGRFLRHLRPFWETHRHRAAPAIFDAVQAMIQAKRLKILAARIIGYEENEHFVGVRIRKRGQSAIEHLRVARIINCTGPDTDLARVRDPLIQSLRASGLIRPDALGLGLDTDQHGALIDDAGRASQRLFLVGPLRKGQLWENTAVPELRIEAAAMSLRLTQAVALARASATAAAR